MTTVASIVNLCLRDIGVLDESETPSAAMTADALTTLNQMLALWQTEGLYIYALQDQTLTADGSTYYTIGPSTGDIVMDSAPNKVNYVYYSIGGIDYQPLTELATFEDYQDITIKTISAYPSVYYYNPTYPLGTLYIYPLPASGTLHVGMDILLPQYTGLTDTINLPAEYDGVIRYNLNTMLAPMMGRKVDPAVDKMAKNALGMLKRSNLKIATLGGTCRAESGMERINRGPY